jgi:hypothetical protein
MSNGWREDVCTLARNMPGNSGVKWSADVSEAADRQAAWRFHIDRVRPRQCDVLIVPVDGPSGVRLLAYVGNVFAAGHPDLCSALDHISMVMEARASRSRMYSTYWRAMAAEARRQAAQLQAEREAKP